MNRAVLLLVACTLVAVGCDKKETSSTSSSTAAAPSDSDLAVPADFADEADKEITKDNYKGELDKLESEIDKDAKLASDGGRERPTARRRSASGCGVSFAFSQAARRTMKPEQIHLGDWKRLLLGNAPVTFLVEVLLRTVAIYAVLIVVLRLLGKRMSGQLTILEMAVMITLGAIVSAAMEIPERGVAIAALLLVCILLFQRGLGRLGFAHRKIELLSQGDVIPLVRDGRLLTDRLEKAALSREQLYSALREHEIHQLGEVKRVYLEACGDFTVLKRRDAKPGLCILPRNDEAMIARCDAKDGLAACTSCGDVQEGAGDEPCPTCGAKSWAAAVT